MYCTLQHYTHTNTHYTMHTQHTTLHTHYTTHTHTHTHTVHYTHYITLHTHAHTHTTSHTQTLHYTCMHTPLTFNGLSEDNNRVLDLKNWTNDTTSAGTIMLVPSEITYSAKSLQ